MTAPVPQRRPSFTLRDRRVLFLMGLVAFFIGFGGALMAHTLPFARKSLGLTEGDMSTLFALVRAASLLGLLFALRADAAGRRKPLLLAYLFLPAGNLITALVPGAPAYVIGQSLTRIGVVAVAGIAIVIVAEELSPALRAYGLGIYGVFGGLGTGLSLWLLPLADSSTDGYRILFGISVLALAAYPILNTYLAESRAYVQYSTRITFGHALRAGLGRHFWPLAGISFFVAAFASPAFDFALERLIDDLQWKTSAAQFLITIFSGAGLSGLFVGGRAADNLGRRPTTVVSLALGLVGGIAFYIVSSGWLLAPAIFVATFGVSMLSPAFAAHRSELFPTRVRASASGWLTNIAILGSIFGFIVGGVMIDSFGLSSTITLLGSGLIIAMFLAFSLPETRGLDLVRGAGQQRATQQTSPPAQQPEPQSPTTPPADPTLSARPASEPPLQ
ncbi:putative sialic acid transporter [bacterium BMS3Bbin02]|nr:putative sialic acid transporter [bacterium BMS3Bbin02]